MGSDAAKCAREAAWMNVRHDYGYSGEVIGNSDSRRLGRVEPDCVSRTSTQQLVVVAIGYGP